METADAGVDTEMQIRALPGNVRPFTTDGKTLLNAAVIELEKDRKGIEKVLETSIQVENEIIIYLLRRDIGRLEEEGGHSIDDFTAELRQADAT